MNLLQVKRYKLRATLKTSLTEKLLSCPRKIIPKIKKKKLHIDEEIYKKNKESFCKNKNIFRFQSGFQKKKHSTNTCLKPLTNKIKTRFERSLFTGMITTKTLLLNLK